MALPNGNLFNFIVNLISNCKTENIAFVIPRHCKCDVIQFNWVACTISCLSEFHNFSLKLHLFLPCEGNNVTYVGGANGAGLVALTGWDYHKPLQQRQGLRGNGGGIKDSGVLDASPGALVFTPLFLLKWSRPAVLVVVAWSLLLRVPLLRRECDADLQKDQHERCPHMLHQATPRLCLCLFPLEEDDKTRQWHLRPDDLGWVLQV